MSSSMIRMASEARLLQETSHKGRMILTILYLCILGLCFVVPIFYYFRMHCEERYARRIRELEVEGMRQAMEESEDMHRAESRAARRKYRAERKARIIQLFVPVKLTLKEENFPHLRNSSGWKNAWKRRWGAKSSSVDKENEFAAESDLPSPAGVDGKTENIEASAHSNRDVSAKSNRDISRKSNRDDSLKSLDEDQLFIELPAQGLQIQSASPRAKQQRQRQVQNICSICLCNYKVGDTVVWSSNEACEHVFHEHCILQWLMKQREGPLCPCCRRDFVLDPYDLDDEEVDSSAVPRTTGSGEDASQDLAVAEGGEEVDEDQPVLVSISSEGISADGLDLEEGTLPTRPEDTSPEEEAS